MSISQNNRMIAIGECGLDKIQGPSLAQQIIVFKKHIEWSEKTLKPIIIHCVKAFNELLEIKNQFQPKQAWIIHGFYSKDEILKKLLHNGCHVSLGTNLLTKVEKLSNYLQIIPINRLFFESDESEVPVSEIYRVAAKILHIDLVHLRQQIWQNFTNSFHIETDALA
jgi:TatD DNase family protein